MKNLKMINKVELGGGTLGKLDENLRGTGNNFFSGNNSASGASAKILIELLSGQNAIKDSIKEVINKTNELVIKKGTKLEIYFTSDITSLESYFNIENDPNTVYIKKVDLSHLDLSLVQVYYDSVYIFLIKNIEKNMNYFYIMIQIHLDIHNGFFSVFLIQKKEEK